MRRLLPVFILALAGCKLGGPSTGGSPSGDLANAVSTTTSAYAVLDIASGVVTYRDAVGDLVGNASYRDTQIVFRRVGNGTNQVLVGVFELTQRQWQRLDPVASTPWTAVATGVVPNTAHGDAYPAYNLAADDLSTALAAYNPSSGARLAIPTLAQWQTAAGSTSGYTWGAQADRAHLVAQAVVRETVLNSGRLLAGTTQIDAGGPALVASRGANGSDIYDLHGNVWEWVAGGTAVRGGSWYDPASLARIETGAGLAQGLLPDVDHALIGARLVLLP